MYGDRLNLIKMNSESTDNSRGMTCCFRGHAWVKGGNWKEDFLCVGYKELYQKIEELFEERNAVEISFWIS